MITRYYLPIIAALVLVACSTASTPTEEKTDGPGAAKASGPEGSTPADATPLVPFPQAIAGAYYVKDQTSTLACKMALMQDGSAIFVGPVPGPESTEYRGTCAHDDGEVTVTAPGLELLFEAADDGSLTYEGDLAAIKGLVMVRR